VAPDQGRCRPPPADLWASLAPDRGLHPAQSDVDVNVESL